MEKLILNIIFFNLLVTSVRKVLFEKSLEIVKGYFLC